MGHPIFAILFIVVIVGGLVYLINQDPNNALIQAEKGYTSAEQLVRTFGNSGEQIAFDLDPQAPLTEWTYIEKVVEKPVYNNATKQYEIVQTTEIEKVRTSEVTVNSKDRQTGDIKKCKRGHQCDITGIITLIDPNTGDDIPPPYGFYMQVTCEESNDPYIHSCQSFSPRAQNILTYGDSSFKYTFTTNSLKDPLGFYKATVNVASKFMITDPETGLQRPEVREGSIRIELYE